MTFILCENVPFMMILGNNIFVIFKFIDLVSSKRKSQVKNLATFILRRLLQGMNICIYV